MSETGGVPPGDGRRPRAHSGNAGAGADAPAERKFGLALAGGGPLGATYELGALVALAEALEGVDLNDLDVYVGVSSGGIIVAGLANGLTPLSMCRMFIESDPAEMAFQPQMLLRPALREYARRAASLPSLLLNGVWHYLKHPFGEHFIESFQRLSWALPAGIFDGAAIDRFLARLFSQPGRTNDFRKLRHRLVLVATDLDSGESVQFGTPGRDAVPISTAVQASAALPGLFAPVEIDGRFYVDGALKKTLHASVALREGATLVLCINPLVPFDSELAGRGGRTPRRLVDGGLPVVLAQTLRAIIHSRMQVGMGQYARQHPGADVVLFEPNRGDAEMFFTNVFSYASRRRLSEHAYQKTRAELLRRHDELAPIFARHGIRIRMDVLRDATRRLVDGARSARGPGAPRPVPALDVLARLNGNLDSLESRLKRRGTGRREAA